MKRWLTKIFAVAFLLFLSSCNKPNPVELDQNNNTDDDRYTLEIVANDPTQFDYENGYDSTGISNPLPRAAAEFVLSLYKNSGEFNQGMGNRIGQASAVFFDLNSPIYNDKNNIVGYLTKDLGEVRFQNIKAQKIPYRIRYRSGNNFLDSLAGVRYHLPFRGMHINFENANISLTDNNDVVFQSSIKIPVEITGSVEKIYDRTNLRGLKLKWNGLDETKIEIIIGAFIGQNLSPFPLVKIKVEDDGQFILPKIILDQVPYKNFESIVFSFIRKIEKKESSTSLSDNYIAAQSIHNIRVNLNN